MCAEGSPAEVGDGRFSAPAGDGDSISCAGDRVARPSCHSPESGADPKTTGTQSEVITAI